jgi:hypothetical protein
MRTVGLLHAVTTAMSDTVTAEHFSLHASTAITDVQTSQLQRQFVICDKYIWFLFGNEFAVTRKWSCRGSYCIICVSLVITWPKYSFRRGRRGFLAFFPYQVDHLSRNVVCHKNGHWSHTSQVRNKNDTWRAGVWGSNNTNATKFAVLKWCVIAGE